MAAKEVLMSSRVQTIFEHRHDDYDRREILRRDPCYYETFKENQDKPFVVQVALGFERFLKEKKILIKEYDILAGFPFRYNYEATIPIHTPDDYDPKFRPKTNIDFYREAEDCIKTLGLADDDEHAIKLREFAKGGSIWMYKHFQASHVIPNYGHLLKVGFGGLIRDAKERLDHASEEQVPYLEAMILADNAAGQYILRYADEAKKMSDMATRPADRNQLLKLEKALRKIAYDAPQTFFEAVQLMWLAHELVYCENFPSAISFGRVDQYLYPFYEKDVKNGILSYEEAQEIIDAFWIKLGATLQGYQNITLGGCDEEGHGSNINPISLMAMRASRKFKFEQPQLCVRCNEDLDAKTWDEIIALLRTGTGFPALFNEKMCIDAKVGMGVNLEDAREFALLGCVEISIPGKEYVPTESLRVNWCKVLELVLQGGKCVMTDDVLPLKNQRSLEDIKTFQEFYEWFKDELLHYSQDAVDCVNLLDSTWVHNYPVPFLSTLFEGCTRNGKDVTAGGALYNSTGINVGGVANVVDSLIVIKKLVFEEGKYTLSQVADACRNNFQGYEDLYYEAVHHCPKYGNDEDEPDFLYRDLISWYGQFVGKQRNPRGGKFQLGMYSVEDHVKMGVWTGALPDGKLAGQSVVNGSAPVQGRDVNGPTAVVNSILKTDLSVAQNGMVLDLKLSPTFFDNPRHIEALKILIQSYFERGGMEIQFNVIDRETLIDAQKHPDKYPELVVRVSGFSAVFTTLIKETQDEIIHRTEHSSI